MKPPRLLLLPGLDGSGKLFSPLIAALGDAVEAVPVAYPPDRPLTYAQLLDDLRRCVPDGDRPWFLLGESFSSPLAIMLAATRPPGLAGLILSTGFARAPRPWLARSLAPLAAWHRFCPGPLLAWSLFGGRADAAALDAVRAELANVAPEVLAARLRAVAEVDAHAALAGLTLPTLALRARRDLIVPAALGGGTVREFDCGHLLLQARAREAASAILDFVRRRPS